MTMSAQRKLKRPQITSPDLEVFARYQTVHTGMSVKVQTGGESFWVDVTSVDRGGCVGRVDNNLINQDLHGLDYGDVIRFEARHVKDIDEVLSH